MSDSVGQTIVLEKKKSEKRVKFKHSLGFQALTSTMNSLLRQQKISIIHQFVFRWRMLMTYFLLQKEIPALLCKTLANILGLPPSLVSLIL